MNSKPTLKMIKTLLIDLDGVLYRGDQPVPGLQDFFRFLRRRSINFLLTSNNATRTPEQYAQKLLKMGVEVEPESVLTSGQATAAYLRERFREPIHLYLIGSDSLRKVLDEEIESLHHVEVRPDVVVVGFDPTLTYEKLRIACVAIRAGAAFVATNPDTTFPAETELYPGTGANIAALEACTGRQAEVVGKPSPILFQMGLKRLGAKPEETAIVGDRLETDIVGGKRAGLTTILVLTGISSRDELGGEIQPDFVLEGVAELSETWEAALERERP